MGKQFLLHTQVFIREVLFYSSLLPAMCATNLAPGSFLCLEDWIANANAVNVP